MGKLLRSDLHILLRRIITLLNERISTKSIHFAQQDQRVPVPEYVDKWERNLRGNTTSLPRAQGGSAKAFARSIASGCEIIETATRTPCHLQPPSHFSILPISTTSSQHPNRHLKRSGNTLIPTALLTHPYRHEALLPAFTRPRERAALRPKAGDFWATSARLCHSSTAKPPKGHRYQTKSILSQASATASVSER